jgi:hypothetical protein
MKFIAHRGNVAGKTNKENRPDHVLSAIEHGFDVEVDVRGYNDRLWLGHDKMDYLVSGSLLRELIPHTWFHCKNLEALEYFASRPWLDANYFWHQQDDYTITSHGNIWAFPGKPVSKNSVILLPEYFGYIIDMNAYGICTDFPIEMKERVESANQS